MVKQKNMTLKRQCYKQFLTTGFVFITMAQYAQSTHDSTYVIEDLHEEVVVTGQNSPQAISQSVYKVHVISKEKILQKSATNIQQVLNTELGIRFSNDMALGVSDISFMGMSGRNVKILVDGVPMLDRGEIRESLNQIDIHQIERIEIVEGPLSVIYGTDALAGVINIITTNPKSDKNCGVNVKLQAETVGKEANLFDHQGLHQESVNAFYKVGRINISGGVNFYTFNGFGGDEFNRNHTWKPKQQITPNAKIGYTGKKHDFFYRFDYLDEEISVKSPINIDNYKGTNKTYNSDRFNHQIQSNVKINEKLWINSSAQYTHFTRKTNTLIKNFSNGDTQLSTAAGDQDLDKFISGHLRSNLNYTVNNRLSLLTGIELTHDQAQGDRINEKPYQTTFSAFVSPEYVFNSGLKIRPGMRMSFNSHYEAPPVIPSLNLHYASKGSYIWRLSYSHGYRAPSLRELHFNFVDANHHLQGNTNLKAETSKSVVASLTKGYFVGEHYFTSEIHGFYNHYNQLITFAVNPAQTDEYINVNIEKFKVMGVGYKHKMNFGSLSISTGALFLGQYNQISEYSQDVSTFNWTPELNVEANYRIESTKTQLSLFYKFYGQRKSFQGAYDKDTQLIITTATLQSYHYADLTVNQKLSKHLTLSFGARNLFDLYDLRNTGVSTGVHTSSSSPFGYGRSYFISLLFNL